MSADISQASRRDEFRLWSGWHVRLCRAIIKIHNSWINEGLAAKTAATSGHIWPESRNDRSCSCVHAHVYIHVCTHVYTHVYTHVCTHTCTHVYELVDTHICKPCASTCLYTCLYVCLYTIHVFTHVCTYVHNYLPRLYECPVVLMDDPMLTLPSII